MVILAWILAGLLVGERGYAAQSDHSTASSGFVVSGYLGSGADGILVTLEGGRSEGVVSGEVLRVFRPARNGAGANREIPIETGMIKAVSVHEHQTIAEVTVQGTPTSRTMLKPYSEIMIGDLAVAQRIAIHRQQMLTKETVLRYDAIFEDSKAHPATFELTDAGRRAIEEVAGELASAKARMMMVAGHTDAKGPAEGNQIESYQRALAVRQYMVEQLGFDKDRVVAIGMGEDELPEGELVPGYEAEARRIVLKVVPLPEDAK